MNTIIEGGGQDKVYFPKIFALLLFIIQDDYLLALGRHIDQVFIALDRRDILFAGNKFINRVQWDFQDRGLIVHGEHQLGV